MTAALNIIWHLVFIKHFDIKYEEFKHEINVFHDSCGPVVFPDDGV